MSEKFNHLTVWEDRTDPKYLKDVSNQGRKYSAIDSMYQLKNAALKFDGAYGSTWGLKDMNYNQTSIEDTILLTLGCKFFYPGGEFEIHNAIKLAYKTQSYPNKPGYTKIDDEAFKKIETNTISKALSKLGFNADVFMGKFEDNSYVQELSYAYADIPGKKIDSEKITEIQKLLKATGTGLDSVLQNFKVKHLGQLNEQQYTDIKDKLGSK